MFNVNSEEIRQFFAKIWKERFLATRSPLEEQILHLITVHPEYHQYLENINDYLDYNWSPEQGESNPFLHLSLHLSIKEQVSIDQPFGIKEIYQTLCARLGSDLEAEHQMMEALAMTIWNAQRSGAGLDVNEYITHLRRLINLGAEDNARKNPHEV